MSDETAGDLHKQSKNSREEWEDRLNKQFWKTMYLLDTNTVIDFFNAKLPDNGKNLLLSIEPAISVITFIELFPVLKFQKVKD